MSNALKFSIEFDSNLKEAFHDIDESIKGTTNGIKDLDKQVKSLVIFETFNQVTDTLERTKASIDNMISPGAALNHNMAELSAITGVTGDKLKEIEANARNTSKAFGIDSAQQVESYKLLLSKLSPEIAQNSEALKLMGENVAITSKLMGGDSTAATEVLTTAMNQYGVDLSDPIRASKEMGMMMNIMAASAKEGSAELPQIKEALEQVGMVAKSTGVSFAETNAAIQVLDKAGKQGAEGGVALRNVLSILGEGRFMAKQSKEALEAYGISVDKLGDKNASLTDRLRLLKPVMHDTALMSQLFGRENNAAAVALINGETQIDKYYNAIQNTNTAYEQSEIIMGSYQESMARTKAWFDDIKVSIFNATAPMLPFTQGMLQGTIAVGQSAQGVNSMREAYSKIKPMLSGISFAPLLTSFQGLWASITATTATGATGVSAIIANIPIIGWIAAAIAAIAALTYYLYNHSRKFNEIIGGVWSVVKLLFGWLWDFIVGFFNYMWEGFKTYVNIVQWVGTTIFNLFKSAFTNIRAVAVWLWNGFKSIFGGVASLVSEYVIAPISKAFDWLMDKVNKVIGWFKTILKPITDAYSEGAKAGGEDYEKRKAQESAKEVSSALSPLGSTGVPSFDMKPKGTAGIVSDSMDKSKSAKGESGGGGNQVKSITNNIQTLGNITIHTTNIKETETELKTMFTEWLMTVLNNSNQQID